MQIFGRARYDYLVNICDEMGIVTPEHPFPVWTEEGGPATIVPMFLLYDYTFLPQGATTKAEGLAIARERNVVAHRRIPAVQRAVRHPRRVVSRSDVVHAKARLEELDWMTPTVLVNHFPMVREPCDAMFYPEFSLWCGTDRDRRLAHPLQRGVLGVRAPAHPAHHVVRRRALRGGVRRLSARVAAPQALSMAAPDAAGPEVRAGLSQRLRRALRDHPGDEGAVGEVAAAHPGQAVDA